MARGVTERVSMKWRKSLKIWREKHSDRGVELKERNKIEGNAEKDLKRWLMEGRRK